MILGDPQVVGLPVTIGCDTQFQVQRVDTNGNAVDFIGPVLIVIETPQPTTIQATVTGNNALFTIPYTTANTLTSVTTYQIVTVVNSLTKPIMVGKFIRRDS